MHGVRRAKIVSVVFNGICELNPLPFCFPSCGRLPRTPVFLFFLFPLSFCDHACRLVGRYCRDDLYEACDAAAQLSQDKKALQHVASGSRTKGLAAASLTRMLRIRMLSAAEVAMPVEEVRTVKEVKQRLHQLHGLPPRFRQRLLLQDRILDDAEDCHSPLSLDLVLQPLVAAETQVDELISAAGAGSTEKAGAQHSLGAFV